MSAKESNAARRNLEGRLEEWADRWIMAGTLGRHIACRGCHKVQTAGKAGEPFQHVDGCPLTSDFARYPWHSLAEILRRLPVLE